MTQGKANWHKRDRMDDKSFDKYLENIGKIPLLSADEDARLARRIRAGDRKAQHALVEGHLRFVVKVAKSFTNQGVSLADLVTAGNIGLIEAANRFDETRGFRFTSYAVWWIRQGIYTCLAESSRIYAVPSQRAAASFALKKHAAVLAHKLMREPSLEELAKELGLSLAEIEVTQALVRSYESMDEIFSNSSSNTLHDVLQDRSVEDPAEAIDRKVLQQNVHAVVSSLPPRERLVVNAYYGLDGTTPCTLEKIGEFFHPQISREAVRQILKKAKRRIKVRMGGQSLSGRSKPTHTLEK